MANPQNPATLEETGLSNFDFNESLTKKVYRFVSEEEWTKMKKKTAITESIRGVSSDILLKKNKRSSQLDRRCESPSNYVKKGFLKSEESVIEENLETPLEDLPFRYHNKQKELFDEVKETFPSLFNCVEQFQDNNGLWQMRVKKDKKAFSADKFVNFVDKITKLFIVELKKLESERNELELPFLYNCCEEIVMGRYLNDILRPTNLLNSHETERWRPHVQVVISFGALLVILDMLKGGRKPTKLMKPKKDASCLLFVVLLSVSFLLVSFLLFKLYYGLSTLSKAYFIVLLVSRCVILPKKQGHGGHAPI